MEKVFIIIPTYNERESIGSLLDRLEAAFQKIPNYCMSVLIFDSNSPDKTTDVIKTYQEKYSNIFLLTEEKKSGLGSAYIQSMKYAYETLHADIVFEFDADGSHSPELLPEMMELFARGADVVLGSRYVPGGSIPSDWGIHRKLLSVFGNIIARCVLSPKIKDYTTGFRGTRTDFLKKINLDSLKSKGYAYKIQLLWLLHLVGAKIIEFPIQFVDRKFGYSKLPKNNIIESLSLVFYLRYQRIKRYIKVCFVGSFGMFLQFSIFNLLRQSIHPVYANIISTECAIISNFFINNYYSFYSSKFSTSDKINFWFKKYFIFNFCSLGSMLLQTVIMMISIDLFGRGFIKENMFLMIGIATGSILNYKMYQYFVWNKPEKSTESM